MRNEPVRALYRRFWLLYHPPDRIRRDHLVAVHIYNQGFEQRNSMFETTPCIPNAMIDRRSQRWSLPYARAA
jgi:hypothetical protein